VCPGKGCEQRGAGARAHGNVQDLGWPLAAFGLGRRRQEVTHYRVGDKDIKQRGEAHEGQSSWL
jgi:hypothetical protein